MPNQAKRSLPIQVQKSFARLWRAPVSSTVTQAAVFQPGAQHVMRLADEAVLAADQRSPDPSLGDLDADRRPREYLNNPEGKRAAPREFTHFREACSYLLIATAFPMLMKTNKPRPAPVLSQ